MRRFVFACVLFTCFAGTANAGIRDEKPNFIGGELMGRGVALTLNYERWLTNNFSLGAGAFLIGADDDMITVFPLYAGFATGDKHSAYFSGGVTIFGGGTFDDFNSTSVTTISAGYQYNSDGGFFVRPLFTLMTFTDDFDDDSTSLIWPGLTIGGSF